MGVMKLHGCMGSPLRNTLHVLRRLARLHDRRRVSSRLLYAKLQVVLLHGLSMGYRTWRLKPFHRG